MVGWRSKLARARQLVASAWQIIVMANRLGFRRRSEELGILNGLEVLQVILLGPRPNPFPGHGGHRPARRPAAPGADGNPRRPGGPFGGPARQGFLHLGPEVPSLRRYGSRPIRPYGLVPQCFKDLGGFLGPALRQQGLGRPKPGLRQLRVEQERLAEHAQRVGVLSSGEQSLSQDVQRLLVGGLDSPAPFGPGAGLARRSRSQGTAWPASPATRYRADQSTGPARAWPGPVRAYPCGSMRGPVGAALSRSEGWQDRARRQSAATRSCSPSWARRAALVTSLAASAVSS